MLYIYIRWQKNQLIHPTNNYWVSPFCQYTKVNMIYKKGIAPALREMAILSSSDNSSNKTSIKMGSGDTEY